jgi:hypothetical protein
MGAFATFLGLCLLFAGWVVVGVLNVYLLEKYSFNETVVVLVMITWLLSGPGWAILFIRWRGKRFAAAFEKMREKLLGKTRDRLKNHSAKD